MALEQITFNIGAFNDSDAGGNNYFTDTVFEVKNQSDNTFATIYADSSGTTQIPQNGIDNVSNSRGECNFYIGEGDFYIEVGSQKKSFSTLKSASSISTSGGSNVQSDLDQLSVEVNESGERISYTENEIDYRKKRSRDVVQSAININASGIWPWGGKGVSILGDSISHMAFSGDAYRNNWTNIFKRCINAEFSAGSYGFVSILDTLGGGTQEIHEVTRVGAWADLFHDNSSWSNNGYAVESSTVNDELQIKVPTFQNVLAVWYHEFTGGGSFDILVNGAVVSSVDCNGSGGNVRTSSLASGGKIDMVDNGYGYCDITIRVTSGTVRITGMSYETREFGVTVNNWSQSGRRLRNVSKDVIDNCMAGSTDFILALGHNDGSANNDPAWLTDVQQRVDWIIAAASTGVKRKVWVLDFTWFRSPDQPIRQELKRCADSIDGATYLALGDYFDMSGETVTPAYLTDNLRLFSDASHPNILGHKMVAEQVAKTMGLGCNTKEQALAFNDFWTTIKLSGGIVNTFASPDLVSAYKRNGNSMLVRGYVKGDGAALTAGTYPLITSTGISIDFYTPFEHRQAVDWTKFDDESVAPFFAATLTFKGGVQGVDMNVRTTVDTNINFAVVVPIEPQTTRL